MISIESARKLNETGIDWQPEKGDAFIVPDRGMDGQVFVVNDMAVIVETLQGTPALTFHGTPEWALDYVFTGDVLWMPSESQLRERLRQALAEAGSAIFDLLYMDGAYTCRFEWDGQALAFRADEAADAYAAALMHILGARSAS